MQKIKLTQGFFAVVDDEDFERVNSFKWHASVESSGTKVYAIRWERDHDKPRVQAFKKIKGKKVKYWRYPQKKIRMHRFIMGLGTGFENDLVVNHINDDSLDNRKENLEVITQDENMEKVERWKRKGQKAKSLEDICL